MGGNWLTFIFLGWYLHIILVVDTYAMYTMNDGYFENKNTYCCVYVRARNR